MMCLSQHQSTNHLCMCLSHPHRLIEPPNNRTTDNKQLLELVNSYLYQLQVSSSILSAYPMQRRPLLWLLRWRQFPPLPFPKMLRRQPGQRQRSWRELEANSLLYSLILLQMQTLQCLEEIPWHQYGFLVLFMLFIRYRCGSGGMWCGNSFRALAWKDWLYTCNT